MGLFKYLKNKKEEKIQKIFLTNKWNKLCELWSKNMLPSPYQELFTYDNYIQGEGHYLFFESHKEKYIELLLKELPKVLKDNLENAFNKYKTLNSNEDEYLIYDDIYYENENLLISILEEYSKTLD